MDNIGWKEIRVGQVIDDLLVNRYYDGGNWGVKCACGREEAVHGPSIIALKNLGMHIACSRCRVQRPFEQAPIVLSPPRSPELPNGDPVFVWSSSEDGELSE